MKKIFLILVSLIIITGCNMANTPTSKVEELMSKYQKMDSDIRTGIDTVIEEQNLTETHRLRYRNLLEKQYENLAYEIKDEKIDGDTATVTIELKVYDYRNAIADLTYDSSIYSKETFDEEKLNRLEGVTDKVAYTIDFTLVKDEDGTWKIDALTNEIIKKIQGMY